MTLPEPRVRVSDLTQLDEAWDIPCDRGRAYVPGKFSCNGNRPARWILHAVPCACIPAGARVMYCEQCKNGVLTSLRLVCRCGAIYMPGCTAYTRIEPLNGGSRE